VTGGGCCRCGELGARFKHRHPELVSGSLEVLAVPDEVLKKVQDDECFFRMTCIYEMTAQRPR
jgi:hypothetical protein